MRRLALLLASVALIAGCQSAPPPYVSHYTPAAAAPPVAAVGIIGDSFTSGSGMGGHGPQGWPAIVSKQMQDQNMPIYTTVGAEGASGYTRAGHGGTAFPDEVPKAVKPLDRLVVLFGSINDAPLTDVLAPAVQKVFAAVKSIAPGTKILVIGPVWPSTEPRSDVLQVRDILKAQAEVAGAAFVDPIAEQWFWDRPDLIGSDDTHPTDAGHAYMAEKITPVITQLLKASPAP